MKYALGTVFGTAVLSLLKSQGSKTRLRVGYEFTVSVDLSDMDESSQWDLSYSDSEDDEDDDQWDVEELESHEKWWTRNWEEEKYQKKLGYTLKRMEICPFTEGILDVKFNFEKIFSNQQDIPTTEEALEMFFPYIRAIWREYFGRTNDSLIDLMLNERMFDISTREVILNADTGEIYRPPVENSSKLRKR